MARSQPVNFSIWFMRAAFKKMQQWKAYSEKRVRCFDTTHFTE